MANLEAARHACANGALVKRDLISVAFFDHHRRHLVERLAQETRYVHLTDTYGLGDLALGEFIVESKFDDSPSSSRKAGQ